MQFLFYKKYHLFFQVRFQFPKPGTELNKNALSLSLNVLTKKVLTKNKESVMLREGLKIWMLLIIWGKSVDVETPICKLLSYRDKV